MSTLRGIHIEALILAASLSLLCFSGVAVAGNKTFCASTSAQFDSDMIYWTTSSDDNVIINLVQGTYNLASTSGTYDQYDAGGSAALVVTGGFALSGTNCVPGPINGANTILDGANARHFVIETNSNITFQGLTVQKMFGHAGSIILSSLGNGVSLKDVIVHDNSAADSGSDIALIVSSSGMLIADSLFYNDGCSASSSGCRALVVSSVIGETSNVEIINTTIASNSAVGVTTEGDITVSMVNDILWNNAGIDLSVNSGGSLDISYSDYSTVSNSGSFIPGSGNIHTDPLFNADYSLQLSPRSPAINAGATQAIVGLLNGYAYPARDLANKQRVVGSRVDLGPYESSYDDQHNQVVTNTAASGPGSLYAAINEVNTHAGASHITFNIPGSCPQIIVLANPLPATNYPLFIDGTTQPGWVANSAAFGAFNGKVCVVLTTGNNGAYALDAASSASHLTVSGLGFAGFTDAAIRLEGGSGHVISDNVFTGGSFVLAPNNDGVRITGTATNTLIGGYDLASSNVFINGTGAGIHVDNAAGGSAISYNLIGVAEDGASAAGNATGIFIFNSPGNVITSNVIGNSASAGIVLAGPGTSASILQKNFIGVSQLAYAPNQQAGILIQQGANNNAIGAIAATDTYGGNGIAENGGPGVWISPSGGSGNSVLANFIDGNGGSSFSNGLAIDLGTLGPDANTCTPVAACMPATSGPNDMQDFPVSLYAVLASAGPIVSGTLDAKPSSTYRLDFYYSPSIPTGYHGRSDGGIFYGTSLVTTDSLGHSNFSVTVPAVYSIATGGWSSATATSLAGEFLVPQNTSEIGSAVQVVPDEIFKDGFGN